MTIAVVSKRQTDTRIPDPRQAKEYFFAKMSFTTGPVELSRRIKSGDVNVVDVRAKEDYQKGHIPSAINLPKDKWRTYEGLRKDKVNVVYCYAQVCHLAAAAALEFANEDYPVMELEGGFDVWKEYELEIEK